MLGHGRTSLFPENPNSSDFHQQSSVGLFQKNSEILGTAPNYLKFLKWEA
jgi:hypothetical protein